VPLAGQPGTVALLTTPDGRDGDRALNPGNRYPEWQQAAAARSAFGLGFYRPGRYAARVRCPLLVLVCDQDQTALAGPATRAAQRVPRGELVRMPAGTTRRSLTATSRPPGPSCSSCAGTCLIIRERTVLAL
jgi:pimeloyl-ACP methyl ester carboxylesterase